MVDRADFSQVSLVALFSEVAITISRGGGRPGYDSGAPTAPSAANPAPPPTSTDSTPSAPTMMVSDRPNRSGSKGSDQSTTKQ